MLIPASFIQMITACSFLSKNLPSSLPMASIGGTKRNQLQVTISSFFYYLSVMRLIHSWLGYWKVNYYLPCYLCTGPLRNTRPILSLDISDELLLLVPSMTHTTAMDWEHYLLFLHTPLTQAWPNMLSSLYSKHVIIYWLMLLLKQYGTNYPVIILCDQVI